MVPKLKLPFTDAEFDALLPEHIKKLSYRHFTNSEVSAKVAQWLNGYKKPRRLLDIGCGVGKFCVAAAALTHHHITGVDYSEDSINIANSIKRNTKLKNLSFIKQNILDVNFNDFNAFYLFNPFVEQIDLTAGRNEQHEISPFLYSVYEHHVRQQLQEMPEGTIVITYYVTPQQMPFNYQIIKTHFDGFLKLWVRK